MALTVVAATLASVVAAPRSAVAQPATVALAPPGDTSHEPASATHTELYGAAILFADLGVLGAGASLVLGLSTGQAVPVFVGGYLFRAPLVHLAHDEPRAAALSFGLRLGLPVLGFLAGDAVEGDGYPDAGAALGALAGMLTAFIVDTRVLARHEVTAEPAVLRVGRVRANPGVSVLDDGGLSLGLSGRC